MRYLVPETEIAFTAIRAQGPGGQHVNKSSTAVHLRFDVSGSGLPDAVKERLLSQSDKRLSADGVLVIKAQSERSLEANKAEAVARLQAIIDRAFAVPKARKPTKPTYGSKQKRLEGKAKRSALKLARGKVME